MSEKDKIKGILEEKEVPEKISPDSIREMLYNHAPTEKPIISVKRNLLRLLSAAAAIALVVGLGTKLYSIQTKQKRSNSIVQSLQSDNSLTNLRYAQSYKDVYDYIDFESYSSDIPEYGMVYDEEMADELQKDFDTGAGETTSNEEQSEKNYTDTYNQEQGVLEADIVKTDGDKIFYSTFENIVVSEVENGQFLSIFTIPNDEYCETSQMYLYNDKLIVICNDSYKSKTILKVYSKETYEQIAEYSQDGCYNDVRLTDDGYLYLMSNDYLYIDGTEIESDDFEKYIPSYEINGKEECLPYDDILISCCEERNNEASFINISSFDMNSEAPCDPTDIKSVVGSAGTIYCSSENLYVTYSFNNTEITRFSIDDGKIVPKAGTSVEGCINDQFSMSEYDGYFRIATTIYNYNTVIDYYTDTVEVDTPFADNDINNAIYILDMNLNEVGKVTDFGIDENIRSVNFKENIAYVVTFRQTDPLYSIDLSDPKAPVIMDELKITGYSSYMQQWGDGLLGFGESGDESGNLNGIKLCMFDNTDPDHLNVIDSLEINHGEDYYLYSEGLYDRKALLISQEHNIIGVPVMTTYYDENLNESGYYFYSFENGKFIELGKVGLSGYDCVSAFNRALIIDDYVYLLSRGKFISADIKTLTTIDNLETN